MKHAWWTAFLLAALLPSAGAQQSGKSVSVGPGPAPSTNYVWVVANGGNLVGIRNPDGTPVASLSGAPFNFNQPFDIVGVPSRHLVFVSNGNAALGTVTVVDSDTLQFVQLLTVPGSTNLRGMSLSEDENFVFVAGQDANGPAVFQISTTSPFTTVRAGGVNDAGRGAADCVVIRAANTGGSGNGPGKVFFSVTNSVPAGYIGVITLPAGFTSIQTGVPGPLAAVNLPDNMERTPDHRAVFVGCSKIIGSGNDSRIIRIDSLTNVASAPIVITGVQDLANNQTWDVTWTTDAGGGNRGFVLVRQDNSTKQLVEIFDTGLPQPVAPVFANQGALTDPITTRFGGLSKQLFVGDIVGTGNGYAAHDGTTVPVTFQNAPIGVGGRCQAFAVMSTPAVVISDICPRGALQTGPLQVTVHGAGFVPGGSYNFGLGLRPIAPGFIDSNTFIADFSGAPVGLANLLVVSPNTQQYQFDRFFSAYAAPEQRPAYTLTLPSVGQGYQMISSPQYATLTALKAALTAALGPYNPVLYRVFFYRGGQYVELNTLADDGCDLAGESYWVLTRNGASVSLPEPDVHANDGGLVRVIPINPGFNMVSQPIFTNQGRVFWNSVLVTTDSTNFGTAVSATSAGGQAILGVAAVEYVNGAYAVADPLVQGRGYWVQNLTSGPAYLVINPAVVNKPGVPIGSAGAPLPAGVNPPPPPSGMASSAPAKSGGCGLSGLEWLLPLGALRFGFLRRRARRTLSA